MMFAELLTAHMASRFIERSREVAAEAVALAGTPEAAIKDRVARDLEDIAASMTAEIPRAIAAEDAAYREIVLEVAE